VRGCQLEIAVDRQKRKVVSDANLRKQRVDCANLNSRAAAAIAHFGCVDVVLSIWTILRAIRPSRSRLV
jgi:hypothetical protein